MPEEIKTPLLDELEKGPWPSFVTEIRMAGETNKMAEQLLIQLETSYREKIGHWKHGGIVGVRTYGGGVIGRYTDMPDKVPELEHFHTIRVNQPAGWFYKTDRLAEILDVWDRRGSGLTNMHGSTGDMVLLGCRTEELQPIFDEISEKGWDLGGSGSALRTPSCCCGMARCEWSCFDTMDFCYNVTQEYQDEVHRPMWPYKFKFKISGCPNDCVASIARSDLSIIGTWKDDIQVDAAAVKEYAEKINIQEEVCDLCPTKCVSYDADKKEICIDNKNCTRCMHCISVMPKALRPGKERGATLLLGAKAPIVHGALLGHVIVPFMKMEPPYDEFKELVEKIWDWWDENGKMRERVGELILRLGMEKFCKAVDLEPDPRMVSYPRTNPYYFWEPEEIQ